MQLFCNFSFVLFFQKGRALARISLLYFTFLFFVCLNAALGEFFRQNPSFGEIYYLTYCCF